MNMATSKETVPKTSKEMKQKDGKGPKKEKQPRKTKRKGKDPSYKSQVVWKNYKRKDLSIQPHSGAHLKETLGNWRNKRRKKK